MEGSVSNVQFTERKRGFDPDEVANYLAHIDEKIAGLRSIAAEAIERAEQAEERARAAESRAVEADESPAQAAGVLAMAQQTADATMAQARAEADALLTSAREEADRHRLSAEAEAQQLLADTRRDLESRRTEHLDTLRSEIDDLVAARDAVAADIAGLETYLGAQRARVVEARDALTRVVEDPEALRAGDLPNTVGGDAGWGGARAGDVWDVSAGDVVVDDVVVVDPDSGMVVEDVVVTDLGSGMVVEDITVTDGVTGEVVAEAVIVDDGDPGAADVPWGTDPGATAPVSTVGGLFDDEAVDAPADASADEAPGGIFGEDPAAGGTYGAFDQEDDEAMRAFFEGEVDERDRPGRWGRRRR